MTHKSDPWSEFSYFDPSDQDEKDPPQLSSGWLTLSQPTQEPIPEQDEKLDASDQSEDIKRSSSPLSEPIQKISSHDIDEIEFSRRPRIEEISSPSTDQPFEFGESEFSSIVAPNLETDLEETVPGSDDEQGKAEEDVEDEEANPSQDLSIDHQHQQQRSDKENATQSSQEQEEAFGHSGSQSNRSSSSSSSSRPRNKKRKMSQEPQEEREASPSSPSSSEDEGYGQRTPFPEKSFAPKSKTKVFNGFCFLLTCFGELGPELFQNLDDRPSEEEMVDLSELVTLIKKHGGKIIDKLSPEAGKMNRRWIFPGVPNLLCITPCHSLSAKFVSAVANSVPPVHFGWILECVQKTSIVPLNDYFLPSGRDESGEFIFMKRISISPIDIFKGARIEVSGDSEFQAFWERAARAAGAKCVRRLFTAQETCINYVLSQEPLIQSIVKRTKEQNIPLVNKQWMFQCLFAGKKIPLNNESLYYFLNESSSKRAKKQRQQ